jgi:hypothetical protein
MAQKPLAVFKKLDDLQAVLFAAPRLLVWSPSQDAEALFAAYREDRAAWTDKLQAARGAVAAAGGAFMKPSDRPALDVLVNDFLSAMLVPAPAGCVSDPVFVRAANERRGACEAARKAILEAAEAAAAAAPTVGIVR